MSANPIWIAGYFGPVAGAAPVWIAPGDGTVPSAVQSEIVSFFSPVAGATAVWIAGFFAPPPAAIGATPITIGGWGGSGGGGPPPVTSVWSAADAAANGMTLSNGGLTVVYPGAANWASIRTSVSKTAGKLYVEFALSTASGGQLMFGVASSAFDITSYLGSTNYSCGMAPPMTLAYGSGFTMNYTPVSSNPASSDVFALAVDFTAGTIWIAKNNVWLGSSILERDDDPSTGVTPAASFVPATVGPLFAGLSFHASGQGTWTLQPTAASQKYAPPSGFSAWDSAAPSHSAQALAYLARTVGGDEGGNGANIATLIDGLVSDGVWAKLDALYVLAQQNQTDALLNLVGTSYSLTINSLVRAPNFTQYVGFSGFSAAVFLNTNFNPTIATSPQYTQNSASLGVWSYANINSSGVDIGADSSVANILATYSGAFYARVNGPAGGISTPGTKGLYAGDRSSSANVVQYWNGASQGAQSSTSAAVLNAGFIVGNAPGASLPTSNTLSAAFIGASLGAAGQLALYNRLRTYMSSVGVP